MAKGSLAELRTQLDISCQINYLDEAKFKTLDEKAVVIGKMLGSLIKARAKSL
jgi:four helix bundle protein